MPDTSSRRLAMNAIVQDEFGPPEVLELRDMPEPVVGDSDVLVNVRAAGCGPDVWHIMTGKPYLVRVMPEVRKQMRGIRGWDVAGIVETVGASVECVRPRRRGDGRDRRLVGGARDRHRGEPRA